MRATGVMLFFLSKKYFGSRNCQKEVKATLELKKPLVLVHEQQEDKGGGSLDVLKAECGGDAMREDIFKERTAIVWHRISHFQNLTLKLIATDMLHHGPTYGSGQEEIRLTFQDELHVSGLALSKPLVIWCSASNPGVAALATELVSSMAIGGQTIRVVYSQDCTLTSLRTLGHTLVHMLLYLNDETWLTQGDVLERDVRAALNAANANAGRLSRFRLGAAEMASGKKSQSKEKIKIILAHENDPKKGGCAFDKFFVNTPEGLVKAGIYRCERFELLSSEGPPSVPSPVASDVAIALHTKPHRDVSLALLARAFGATKTGRPSVRDGPQAGRGTVHMQDVQVTMPERPPTAASSSGTASSAEPGLGADFSPGPRDAQLRWLAEQDKNT